MAATTEEDEDFWGHKVDERTSVKELPTLAAQQKNVSIEKATHAMHDADVVSSRRNSVKTVKSVKHATIQEGADDVGARDADVVSIKKRSESANIKEKTRQIDVENETGDIKKEIFEAEIRRQSKEIEIERERTPSPVSDGPGDPNSRASLISDADNYYKDEEFEVDDHLDSQIFKEDTIFSDLDEPTTTALEQSTAASKFDEKTSDIELTPLAVVDEPKKKIKKKKKDDKKKKDEKKGSRGILGMLTAPTVLAGAIVQTPAEAMKGKMKKKTSTTSTSIAASIKTPIKKKITSLADPRPSKSSRSRLSLDEITYLRKQLDQTIKENRTLRQIQRRQDAALARLEGTNSDMPNLVNRYNEEFRIMKEQLRSQKEKNRERDRILRERSMQMEKLRDKAKKLEKMLNEKGGSRRKRDDKEAQKLEELLEDKEKRIKELERQTELLSKNFKHQFNIEVLRHKETQRKLTEYSSEYQRLTGRDLNLNNNNNNNTYFSQRSPRRTNGNVEPSPRRIVEAQVETKTIRSNTADVLTNGAEQRNLSKSRKMPKASPQRSPIRKPDANSNKKASANFKKIDDERSLSPKMTLFADYQRSLTSTPKKSDAQAPSSYAAERLSSPLNDDLIRASSQASRRSNADFDRKQSAQKKFLSQVDAQDSLLDFTKRPLGVGDDSSTSKNLIADDPFVEMKKNAPSSSTVRPSPSNFIDELFTAQNGTSKTKSFSDKQAKISDQRSTQNSADSGLASTDGSPNGGTDQRENKTTKNDVRKNVFDIDDEDLFPMAKVKNGPKMANGLFPWEQEALTKTKS